MSLEQAIADLTAATGANNGIVANVAAAALAQVNAVGAAYTDVVSRLHKTVFVDQSAGIDTNPGTEAQPVKSVVKAISMVPPGGTIDIYLKSNYTFKASESTVLSGHCVFFSSLGTKRTIYFEKSSLPLDGTTYRVVSGLRCYGQGEAIRFYGLDVAMPEAVSPETGYSERDASAMIQPFGDAHHGQTTIEFYQCQIIVPNERYGPLCSVLGASVIMQSTTIGGDRGHLRGRVFRGVNADAGVDPVTLRINFSNLSLV